MKYGELKQVLDPAFDKEVCIKNKDLASVMGREYLVFYEEDDGSFKTEESYVLKKKDTNTVILTKTFCTVKDIDNVDVVMVTSPFDDEVFVMEIDAKPEDVLYTYSSPILYSRDNAIFSGGCLTHITDLSLADFRHIVESIYKTEGFTDPEVDIHVDYIFDLHIIEAMKRCSPRWLSDLYIEYDVNLECPYHLVIPFIGNLRLPIVIPEEIKICRVVFHSNKVDIHVDMSEALQMIHVFNDIKQIGVNKFEYEEKFIKW